MESQAHVPASPSDGRPADERARIASKLCRDACTQYGFKVDTWTNFNAWLDYVDGRTDEDGLKSAAQREMKEYSVSHGNDIVIEQEVPAFSSAESERKRRAKRANKIIRQICGDLGLNLCFFNNFSAWSSYVSGVLTENELVEEAHREMKAMAAQIKEAQQQV